MRVVFRTFGMFIWLVLVFLLESTSAEAPRAGDIRSDNGERISLVWCPPGSFKMGTSVANWKKLWPDESLQQMPLKQVRVELTSGFWLGKYEVTQKEWIAVMGMDSHPWEREADEYLDPTYREGHRQPVTYVEWSQAMEFCRRLTKQERKAGRLRNNERYTLPTEAQWEYACRAGTKTAFSFGNDVSHVKDFAWCSQSIPDEAPHAHRVGLKRPNAWGMHDMHGNVEEWCLDMYGSTRDLAGGPDPFYSNSRITARVCRGGDWRSHVNSCTSSCRGGSNRVGIASGFRIALVATPAKIARKGQSGAP